MRRAWFLTSWLHPLRRARQRDGRFARILARPGFNPHDVLHEVSGSVEHGPAGAAPTCRGEDGVVALLVGRQLAWTLPDPVAGRSGFVAAAQIVAWSSGSGLLVVRHRSPVAPADDTIHELRIVGEPAQVADFVRRAARILPPVNPSRRPR
jgi:hypothetical protein